MRLLRLYLMLFSLSLRRQLTFRSDLVFELVRTVVALASSLAALLAVFTRTDELGGFTAHEAVMLLGTFQIISGLRQGLVEPNLRFNGKQVADGSFDAILTQPAPPIFLSSLASAAPLALTQSLLGAAMLIATTVADRQQQVGLGAVVGWVVLVATAAVTMWATRCIIAATVFWALEFSLDVAYDALWQLGAYPTTLLQQPLRTLTYILPVAFIATIPTAVLVDDLNPAWALVGVGAAALTTAAALLLWRVGIRNYSSATS